MMHIQFLQRMALYKTILAPMSLILNTGTRWNKVRTLCSEAGLHLKRPEIKVRNQYLCPHANIKHHYNKCCLESIRTWCVSPYLIIYAKYVLCIATWMAALLNRMCREYTVVQ